MIKYFILAGLIGLVSCGKEDLPEKFGQIRKFEPLVVNDTDKARIAGICSQLAQKAILLDSSAGRSFTFDVAEKSCDATQLAASTPAVVTVSHEGSEYYFKQGLSYFKFQYIETNGSGRMKEICANLDSLTNPFKASNGSAIWFSFNAAVEHCPFASGQTCVVIDVGVADATGKSYAIQSTDWMRFVTDSLNPLVGFYTHRKLRSRGYCTDFKFTDVQATLKE